MAVNSSAASASSIDLHLNSLMITKVIIGFSFTYYRYNYMDFIKGVNKTFLSQIMGLIFLTLEFHQNDTS